jgi:hypothetical protein
MKTSLLLLAVAYGLICGCAPAAPLLVGPARAPIAVEQVVIYQQPPPNSTDVAILKATSHSVFSPGGPAATDTVVQRLKVRAAGVHRCSDGVAGHRGRIGVLFAQLLGRGGGQRLIRDL